jgi:putative ABC transport system permease protein
MAFFESVRLALSQIRVQKLKSFFTLLGVMIGVMFLIAVVSIVEGMSRYMTDEFAAKILGVNTFTLRRTPDVFMGDVTEEMWREWQRRPRVYQADVDIVREVLPDGVRSSVENVRFIYATSPYNRPRQVMAFGTEATYFQIKKYEIERGRAFTPLEASLGTPVVVIGTEIAEHFFPDLDPLGREIRIAGTPYQVIGVMEKQGSIFGFSMDRMAIAPYTSPMARQTNPRGDIDGLVVQAPREDVLSDAMEETRSAMRGFRRLSPSQQDNFTMETADEALGFFAELKGRMIVFGTALPAIGLIVGAMVIMNIMLVAVAERTHEIGIRKAIGARQRDIRRQFLVEAATLSVIGAILGISLGIGLAKTVAALTPLPASVAPWSIVMAVIVGAGVGIVAGFYPATRAARLDPIIALQRE